MSRIGSLALAALAASLTILSASHSWGQSCQTVGSGTPTLRWAHDAASFYFGREVAEDYNALTGTTIEICRDTLLPITQAVLAPGATYDFFFGGHQDYATILHTQFPESSEPFLYAKSIPILIGMAKNRLDGGTPTILQTVGDLVTGLPNPSATHAVVSGTDLSSLQLVTTGTDGITPRRNFALPATWTTPAPIPSTLPLGPTVREIVTHLGNGFTWPNTATVPNPPFQAIPLAREAGVAYSNIWNGQNRAGFISKDYVYVQGRQFASGGLCTTPDTSPNVPPCPGLDDGPYVEFQGYPISLYAIRLRNTATALNFKQYFDTSLANGSWNTRLSQWQYATIPGPAPVPIGPYTAPLTAALLLALGLYFMNRQDTLRVA